MAADILGPLVDDVVFVGGATIHLWLTETAAPPVRATDDVDVICDVSSYVQYQALAERLRDRGLEEAIDEPVGGARTPWKSAAWPLRSWTAEPACAPPDVPDSYPIPLLRSARSRCYG